MTTRLAFLIMAFIIGFLLLDHYVFGLNAGLFLAKKGFILLEHLAFWR